VPRHQQVCPFRENRVPRPASCDFCQDYLHLRHCACEFPHQTATDRKECLYCGIVGHTFWSFFEHTGRVHYVRYLCGNCNGMWSMDAVRYLEQPQCWSAPEESYGTKEPYSQHTLTDKACQTTGQSEPYYGTCHPYPHCAHDPVEMTTETPASYP